MESKDTTYDRAAEVKAFDETMLGVKGLADAGITKIPSIFHNPLAARTNPKPSSMQVMIPTIDLGGCVFESMVKRESVVAKLKGAMEKFGFFQVINHGIPLNVLVKMREGVRGFHDLDPKLRKMFYTRDKTKMLKYMSNADIYESPAANWRDTLSCFMAPDVPKPEELPEICGEIMLEFSKRIMKVAEFIFELISESLGLNPNHLREMDCAKGLLMLCHCYPPCPEPDRTLGAAPHTDRTFITILLKDHIGGLQVLHDGYWIDVPSNPEALVVNVGDFLQLITNDKFVSVEHKVLANGSQEPSISIACFFIHPPTSASVFGPIKELLSEQNPPKYRDSTAEVATNYVARTPNLNNSLSHLRI